MTHRKDSVAAVEPEPNSTIREVPRMNPYRMAAVGARAQPIPPPVSDHSTHLPVTPVSLQNRSQFFPHSSNRPGMANQGLSSVGNQSVSSVSSHRRDT